MQDSATQCLQFNFEIFLLVSLAFNAHDLGEKVFARDHFIAELFLDEPQTPKPMARLKDHVGADGVRPETQQDAQVMDDSRLARLHNYRHLKPTNFIYITSSFQKCLFIF